MGFVGGAKERVPSQGVEMPIYLTCPHCDHPTVVPPHRHKSVGLCRQCGCGYLVSERLQRAMAVPARTFAQLKAWVKMRRMVSAA